ncbi:MAG: CaiB/BaiF CoA transferase family protein [Pseudomonadota bacterium]
MLPLEGVTILAVEQYGAGPFGTMLLADMGAVVLKIENPKAGGDVGRHVGPHRFGPDDSHFFQSFNRNKQSLTLDLQHADGRRVFRDLVRGADGVLDNLRGDLPDRLGLTYDALKDVNPRIVCAHLSAYGREGPRRNWPGYDYLMQAEAGYLAVTGEPSGPPTRFGLSVVDMMTGVVTALGLLGGIIGARATGRGRDVDVSLFDTALHNLSYLATWYLNGGFEQGREPRSGHPSLVPSQLYTTADGWLFVMCNKEKFWGVLADALGHPEWKTDPRLCDFRARLEHRTLVTELLDGVLRTQPTAAWLDTLGGRVPCAPVYGVGTALDNPFVRVRDGVRAYHYPDGRRIDMLTSPLRFPGEPTPSRAAPAMGADTEAVLRGLGYDTAEIDRLQGLGVVRAER